MRHTRGPTSAAEPPGCPSLSLSLLDSAAAALLLLAPERLRFSTGPHELAPPPLLALAPPARCWPTGVCWWRAPRRASRGRPSPSCTVLLQK